MITTTVTRSGTPPKVIAHRLPYAIQAGTVRVTVEAYRIAGKKIAKIYQRAIPTEGQVRAYEWSGSRGRIGNHSTVWRKSVWKSKVASKKAWSRTGRLKGALKMWGAAGNANLLSGAGMSGWGRVGTPNAKYANGELVHGPAGNVISGPRHEIGESWKVQNPALGVVRRNPWWKETDAELAPQVVDRFNEGFQRAMNK